jgi:hypothetical protein
VTLGGFQSAVRVARDPSRFRRQGRSAGGAQASLRDGGAGGGPRELLGRVTSSLSRVRIARRGRGQSRRFPAPATVSEGTWLEASRGRASARNRGEQGRGPHDVTIVRTRRESHGGGNIVVSRGSVAVDGEAIRQHREIVGLRRPSEGVRSGLPGSAFQRKPRYTGTLGQPDSPRTRRVPELGAFPMPLAFRRQDRGGNITASDALWVIGCVRSAVCQVSVGVGVRVEVAPCSWRAERAGFGSFDSWFGCVGVSVARRRACRSVAGVATCLWHRELTLAAEVSGRYARRG